MPMNDEPTTPSRIAVLTHLAVHDALPLGDSELDYYVESTPETYDRAIDAVAAAGWSFAEITQETLTGGTKYETFRVGDVQFVSPKGHLVLTSPNPIERLAQAPVIVKVGDVEAEITGPFAVELRDVISRLARGPLPSRDDANDGDVVPIRRRGRGHLSVSRGDAS